MNGRTANPLPPLAMIRAFEAVGRTGSMRRAAEDIGVSHNAVSYHIRNLEAWLKTRLVERSPRGVTLTANGRAFHGAVSQALAVIADAAAGIRPAAERASLRVWCMAGLASLWLTPRLSELEQHLSGVEIIVRPMTWPSDLAPQEADLLIGFGDVEDMPGEAELLVHPRFFPVVSPQWLERNAAPATIADLVHCPLIHEDSKRQWGNWLRACDIEVDHDRLPGSSLWSANLCIEAALAGQGIALGLEPLVQDTLRAGKLVKLFDTDVRLGVYFLMETKQRPSSSAAVARFRDWITGRLAEDANR